MTVHIIWSSVHIAPLCAWICAHDNNATNRLCLAAKEDLKFQVWWKSDLVWLRYMTVHIVSSSVHIAPLCACMYALHHNAINILCWVPKEDLKLKIWWKSDLFWLRYMIVHIAKSSMHITLLCACMCAHNPNVKNILCLVAQKDFKFQVWRKSDLIWLRYEIVNFGENSVQQIGQR